MLKPPTSKPYTIPLGQKKTSQSPGPWRDKLMFTTKQPYLWVQMVGQVFESIGIKPRLWRVKFIKWKEGGGKWSSIFVIIAVAWQLMSRSYFIQMLKHDKHIWRLWLKFKGNLLILLLYFLLLMTPHFEILYLNIIIIT